MLVCIDNNMILALLMTAKSAAPTVSIRVILNPSRSGMDPIIVATAIRVHHGIVILCSIGHCGSHDPNIILIMLLSLIFASVVRPDVYDRVLRRQDQILLLHVRQCALAI